MVNSKDMKHMVHRLKSDSRTNNAMFCQHVS